MRMWIACTIPSSTTLLHIVCYDLLLLLLPFLKCLKAAPVFWTLRETQKDGDDGSRSYRRTYVRCRNRPIDTCAVQASSRRYQSRTNTYRHRVKGFTACSTIIVCMYWWYQQFIVILWNCAVDAIECLRWGDCVRPARCIEFCLIFNAAPFFPSSRFLWMKVLAAESFQFKRKTKTKKRFFSAVPSTKNGWIYFELLFSWLCLPRINCIWPALSVCNRTIHWVERNDEHRQWIFRPVSECR